MPTRKAVIVVPAPLIASPTQEKPRFPSVVTTLVLNTVISVMKSSPEIPAPTLTVSERQMNIWLLKNFHLYNKLFASSELAF